MNLASLCVMCVSGSTSYDEQQIVIKANLPSFGNVR